MADEFTFDASGRPIFEKDPDSVRPFAVDLGSHPVAPLDSSRNLVATSWSVESGPDSSLQIGDGVGVASTAFGDVTPQAPSFSGKLATAVFYGGTLGSDYVVRLSYRSDGSPEVIDDVSVLVRIGER